MLWIGRYDQEASFTVAAFRARFTDNQPSEGAQGPIAVSAHAEIGEIALARGQGADAASAYRAALDIGQATGLVGSARAALLRKRAMALASTGRFQEAVGDLEVAYGLLIEGGDRATATRVLIEQATALQHSGLVAEAAEVVQRARSAAEPLNDHAALADLDLLSVTQSLERHDAPAALASAHAAREHALAANAPTSYIGAAVAIAQLAESAGDHLQAYEALAVGWVTFADLMGPDLARTTFEPKLRELRERWGATAFEAVKGRYEADRRARMKR